MTPEEFRKMVDDFTCHTGKKPHDTPITALIEWADRDRSMMKEAKDFIVALDEAQHAICAASALWTGELADVLHSGDIGYPSYLPSFDEFMLDWIHFTHQAKARVCAYYGGMP